MISTLYISIQILILYNTHWGKFDMSCSVLLCLPKRNWGNSCARDVAVAIEIDGDLNIHHHLSHVHDHVTAITATIHNHIHNRLYLHHQPIRRVRIKRHVSIRIASVIHGNYGHMYHQKEQPLYPVTWTHSPTATTNQLRRPAWNGSIIHLI